MVHTLKKYYWVRIEPHPDQPGRQRLSLLPSFRLKHPKSGTMDWHIHLVWYSDPGKPQWWVFDHLTIVQNVEILTSMPDFIAQMATIRCDTQPQEVENQLLQLGFHRDWSLL